ncbi:hypothetical protein Tco_1546700 [Tanacetum coccineum]
MFLVAFEPAVTSIVHEVRVLQWWSINVGRLHRLKWGEWIEKHAVWVDNWYEGGFCSSKSCSTYVALELKKNVLLVRKLNASSLANISKKAARSGIEEMQLNSLVRFLGCLLSGLANELRQLCVKISSWWNIDYSDVNLTRNESLVGFNRIQSNSKGVLDGVIFGFVVGICGKTLQQASVFEKKILNKAHAILQT